jgi:hypothetical protein
VLVRPLPDDLAAVARAYAGTHGVPLPAVWHTALLTVLHRHTGRTDLAIGSGATGVLRADLSGEPTAATRAGPRRDRAAVSGPALRTSGPRFV